MNADAMPRDRLSRVRDDEGPNGAATARSPSTGAGDAGELGAAGSVVLDGDRVVIRDLAVDGAAVELVKGALADGSDPESAVRQAVGVGAAVLLHGAAKGTMDAVAAEVDRLLTAIDEKSANLNFIRAAREKVSSRGLFYEEDLGPALDACFAPHEDVVEATGTVKGIAEDKVGDFVVTINPRDTAGGCRRIVFEAKDQRLSAGKALEELDAAMLNRGAQVGVMVFASAKQAPLLGKPLRVFPGNRLIVVRETGADGAASLALDIAAQLARTLALAVERQDGKLNRRALAERLAQLVNTVEQADGIARGIDTARRGLDAAEDAYNRMAEDALATLYELQDRL